MERVKRIRSELRGEYDELDQLYTDAYLEAIVSVPGRSYECARDEKVREALKWRRGFNVDALCAEASFCQGEWRLSDGLSITRPRTLAMYRSGLLAWDGPVLWSIVGQTDWTDEFAILQYHVRVIEHGITAVLPKANTDSFQMVVDVSQLGIRNMPSLSIVRALASLLQTAYPERIDSIRIGPVSMALVALFALTKPFLSQSSRDKITLVTELPARPNFE